MSNDPFLRVIRDEAMRLDGGVLISAGHVAAILDAPTGSAELAERLLAWCDGEGLDAQPEEPDGIRFTRRRGPLASELTAPAPAPTPTRRRPTNPAA